jgi:hypothetical protein
MWTNTLRSSVDVGRDVAFGTPELRNAAITPLAIANGFNRSEWSGALNIIWSPIPPIDTGFEYIYGSRQTPVRNGATSNFGHENRIQWGAKAYF